MLPSIILCFYKLNHIFCELFIYTKPTMVIFSLKITGSDVIHFIVRPHNQHWHTEAGDRSTMLCPISLALGSTKLNLALPLNYQGQSATCNRLTIVGGCLPKFGKSWALYCFGKRWGHKLWKAFHLNTLTPKTPENELIDHDSGRVVLD